MTPEEKCKRVIKATNKLANFLNQSGFTNHSHDFDGELLQYLEFSLIAACGGEETFKYYTENAPYPCPGDLRHFFYNARSNFREQEARDRDYANKESERAYLKNAFFTWLQQPEKSGDRFQYTGFPMGIKLAQCSTLENKKGLIKRIVVKLYKEKLYGSQKVRQHINSSANRYDGSKVILRTGSLLSPLAIVSFLGSSTMSAYTSLCVMVSCCATSHLCGDKAQAVRDSNSQGLYYGEDSEFNYVSGMCQFFSRGSTSESREAYLLEIPDIAETIENFERLLDEILASTLDGVGSVADPSSSSEHNDGSYELVA